LSLIQWTNFPVVFPNQRKQESSFMRKPPADRWQSLRQLLQFLSTGKTGAKLNCLD
jgi:hypothetical protein